MIKRGDQIKILPEWQDEGDDQFTWMATDDEEKGRVTISPIDFPATFLPTQTVLAAWIEKVV